MAKQKYTDFDIRMKDYEHRARFLLPRRSYTMVRLDGKSFHTYTKQCKKPFDFDLINDMQETAWYLCQNTMGAVMAYHQSDEITMLLCDFKDKNTEAYFNNNLQKLTSILASMATAEFNRLRYLRIIRNIEEGDEFDHTSVLKAIGGKPAMFDCRVWSLSDPWEVYNSFLWRQQDATKNAISMAASAYISHKKLHGLNGKEKQEALFQAEGINFNDYPIDAKRGALICKSEEGQWIIDKQMPIITQDPKYLQSKIPLIPVW